MKHVMTFMRLPTARQAGTYLRPAVLSGASGKSVPSLYELHRLVPTHSDALRSAPVLADAPLSSMYQ